MAKSEDAEMKKLGSDASQELGPLRKRVEDAFKTAGLVAKNPNPKLMETLADQIESIMSDTNDLKSLLKEVKSAAK